MAVTQAHPEPVELPTASSMPSLSPIPKLEPSVLNDNVKPKRQTASESKLRRKIIQDVSVQMTSALKTALESLVENDSDEDSFEHIESDSPNSGNN